MSFRTISIAVLFALTAVTAIAVPAAGVAKAPLKVQVGLDPSVGQAEAEAEEKLEPYVLFSLKGAILGRLYRLLVEEAPDPTAALPCNSGLYTSWTPAFGPGEVAFPLEPVESGTYMPFAGAQPCKGRYEMEVQERKPSERSWDRVRRFAFSYPSLKVTYLPTH